MKEFWLALACGTCVVCSALAAAEEFAERDWAQLSNKDVSEWGRAALELNLAMHKKWKHGETEHFIIHFTRNGAKIAARSEKFYAKIRAFFGNPPDLKDGLKSHIFAVHDRSDWERFISARMPRAAIGVTRGDEFFYLATGDEGQFDAQGRVQAHEMTHLVFNRLYRGRVPLWLNEGIAEYFGKKETMSTAEFRQAMGTAVQYDLDKLFDSSTYPRTAEDMHSFYSEAAIVVDFLTRNERETFLPKFVERTMAGDDLDTALKVFGFKDEADFRAAYKQYRRKFR
jgi:hypothetical protein